jgi:hypothetical protein
MGPDAVTHVDESVTLGDVGDVEASAVIGHLEYGHPPSSVTRTSMEAPGSASCRGCYPHPRTSPGSRRPAAIAWRP